MNKHLIMAGPSLAALLLAAPISNANPSSPSPKPTSIPSPSAATSSVIISATKTRLISFRGMVASVDQKAKTFVVAGKEKSRSVRVTDKTVTTKRGQPATIKDIVANEEVRGTCTKDPSGIFEAKTVKLGPLTEAEKSAEESYKEHAGKKIGGSPVASPTASSSASPKT